jgi:hypothetical protein
MPESEFDKQVQKELEGLRIRPSATVWENVEKELRQKKRRRVIIAFWLIAGIALLGSTTYFFTRKDDKILSGTAAPAGKPGTDATAGSATITGDQPAVPHSAEAVSTPQDAAQDVPANTITDKNNLQSKDKTPQLQNGENNAAVVATSNTKTTAKSNLPAGTLKSTAQSPTVSVGQRASGKKKNSSRPIEGAIVKGKVKRPGQVPAEKDPVVSSTDNRAVDATDTPVTTAPATVTPGNAVESNIAAVTPAVDSTSVKADGALTANKEDSTESPAKITQKKADKKLKWSLDLAIGGSGPVSRPFAVGDNHADMAYDNVQYTPVQGGGLWQPVTPPLNGFAPVYSPRSDIKPGLSYRAGVLFEIPLSERVSFSSGLQYQYLSNNIRIGSYVNSRLIFNNFASQQVQANGVYQGTQMKTFTNRYHYVQIPMVFNWQLNNKSSKMPVILNTGLSAGYLVATNALTYDTLQGGTYYHDNNAFKRFQFSFTTGVSFRFGNKRAMQWSIGPEASMGLRKMVKTEYDTRQYPLYIGLQGRIYLPKKKK